VFVLVRTSKFAKPWDNLAQEDIKSETCSNQQKEVDEEAFVEKTKKGTRRLRRNIQVQEIKT
jgi:hypothetical protein